MLNNTYHISISFNPFDDAPKAPKKVLETEISDEGVEQAAPEMSKAIYVDRKYQWGIETIPLVDNNVEEAEKDLMNVYLQTKKIVKCTKKADAMKNLFILSAVYDKNYPLRDEKFSNNINTIKEYAATGISTKTQTAIQEAVDKAFVPGVNNAGGKLVFA